MGHVCHAKRRGREVQEKQMPCSNQCRDWIWALGARARFQLSLMTGGRVSHGPSSPILCAHFCIFPLDHELPEDTCTVLSIYLPYTNLIKNNEIFLNQLVAIQNKCLLLERTTESLVISTRVFTSYVATACSSAFFYLVELMSCMLSTADI